MPLFRSGMGEAPSWCEVEFFEILALAADGPKSIVRQGRRERLFVVSGSCTLEEGSGCHDMGAGEVREIDDRGERYQLRARGGDATIVRLCGRWGAFTGPSGVFQLSNDEHPANAGDPAPYPRKTVFDNHYHDCDEYWVIVDGRCQAVSGGQPFDLRAGDCLVTGAGWHHDIPVVHSRVTGVYFEGTLEGQKRVGHLWERRDGPAIPQSGRT